jgi:hypothetical protein
MERQTQVKIPHLPRVCNVFAFYPFLSPYISRTLMVLMTEFEPAISSLRVNPGMYRALILHHRK